MRPGVPGGEPDFPGPGYSALLAAAHEAAVTRGPSDKAWRIECHNNLFLPGLLQHKGYREALLRSAHYAAPYDLRLSTRIRYTQEVLEGVGRGVLTYVALVPQKLLTTPKKYAHDQLAHLLWLTSTYTTNLYIHILPDGFYPGQETSWNMLYTPTGKGVIVDTLDVGRRTHRPVPFTDSSTWHDYAQATAELKQLALTTQESIALIQRNVQALR